VRSHRDILESRMQGNLARPVWGWGPGEIPGPTPLFVASAQGGFRAAIRYSLASSARSGGGEPYAWLKDWANANCGNGCPARWQRPSCWTLFWPACLRLQAGILARENIPGSLGCGRLVELRRLVVEVAIVSDMG